MDNPIKGTVVNSEDPDQTLQNAAFALNTDIVMKHTTYETVKTPFLLEMDRSKEIR